MTTTVTCETCVKPVRAEAAMSRVTAKGTIYWHQQCKEPEEPGIFSALPTVAPPKVDWREKARKRMAEVAARESQNVVLDDVVLSTPPPAKPPSLPSKTAPTSSDNPYKGGQKAACYDLLKDGKPHSRGELSTINAKYPMDSVSFLEKDGKSNGLWTIIRSKDSVKMERK